MTAQENMTAVLAAINAQFSSTRAYDLDEVPSPRPAEYIEVTVSRMFGGERRMCATKATTGYRVTARGVSQTQVSNVRNALEKTRTALEYRNLSIGPDEAPTTPIQFETEDPAAYDDGWFSGLLTFTYAVQE